MKNREKDKTFFFEKKKPAFFSHILNSQRNIFQFELGFKWFLLVVIYHTLSAKKINLRWELIFNPAYFSQASMITGYSFRYSIRSSCKRELYGSIKDT